MKSLYASETVQEIQQRLGKLESSSQGEWGTMNVAQMLAHCATALEVASAEYTIPRLFISRIVAPFIKKAAYNDKPLPKNVRTVKALIVTDTRDFTQERQRLVEKVLAFSQAGEAGCTRQPHPFFGKLTPTQWGMAMYKHLDHHLRQFGV